MRGVAARLGFFLGKKQLDVACLLDPTRWGTFSSYKCSEISPLIVVITCITPVKTNHWGHERMGYNPIYNWWQRRALYSFGFLILEWHGWLNYHGPRCVCPKFVKFFRVRCTTFEKTYPTGLNGCTLDLPPNQEQKQIYKGLSGFPTKNVIMTDTGWG